MEIRGDQLIWGQQLLEERGVEADNFWLLGNLIIALEGVEDLGVDCAEICATLISMEVGYMRRWRDTHFGHPFPQFH